MHILKPRNNAKVNIYRAAHSNNWGLMITNYMLWRLTLLIYNKCNLQLNCGVRKAQIQVHVTLHCQLTHHRYCQTLIHSSQNLQLLSFRPFHQHVKHFCRFNKRKETLICYIYKFLIILPNSERLPNVEHRPCVKGSQ